MIPYGGKYSIVEYDAPIAELVQALHPDSDDYENWKFTDPADAPVLYGKLRDFTFLEEIPNPNVADPTERLKTATERLKTATTQTGYRHVHHIVNSEGVRRYYVHIKTYRKQFTILREAAEHAIQVLIYMSRNGGNVPLGDFAASDVPRDFDPIAEYKKHTQRGGGRKGLAPTEKQIGDGAWNEPDLKIETPNGAAYRFVFYNKNRGHYNVAISSAKQHQKGKGNNRGRGWHYSPNFPTIEAAVAHALYVLNHWNTLPMRAEDGKRTLSAAASSSS